VSHAGPPRWHIYSETIESADANNDWVAYAKKYHSSQHYAYCHHFRLYVCFIMSLLVTKFDRIIAFVF
jgi:hypothetical protein